MAMSNKEVEATISLLHMMQPAEAPAQQDALHDSLLQAVASHAPDELPLKRRAKRRNARLTALSHDLTLDELRAHFDKPIVEVAKAFGISTTFLKKICRRLGIKRWPHRQIRSLARTIQMLEQVEAVAKTPHEKAMYAEKIDQLKIKQQAVLMDPDANGKLKRMKKVATPGKARAGKNAASSSDDGSGENDAVVSDANEPTSGRNHLNSHEHSAALTLAANSLIEAAQRTDVTKESLVVVIPQPPPLAVEIPTVGAAPSPVLLTTPLHAAASGHAVSPSTLKISPSNRKLELVKADAESRLRSSSIGSLQDQPEAN